MVLSDLRQGFAAYRNDEVPRLLHGLKTALAAVLCMLVCMRLELRAPGTAMVSAVIVMLHQQSGMVIARAFYRALGICFGGVAGLVLMCMFAQQPPLFLAGLALWVGLFVAGASYYRNFQSYGFVLSGYAASIVTVPEWSNPYDVATNVIYTVSEVLIGVASGSLISAIFLPQRVTPALAGWRQHALARLLQGLKLAALGNSPAEPMSRYLGLVTDSMTLEQLRTAAMFEEPEMRLRHEALFRLESAFIDALTRIHAICRAREGAAQAGPTCREWVDRLFARLIGILSRAEQTGLRSDDAIESLRDELHALEYELPGSINRARALRPGKDPQETAALAMAGSEIYAAVSSLRRFCSASRVASVTKGAHLTQSIFKAISFMRVYQLRSSPSTALIAGIRAACAMGFVGTAWVLSGWTNGFTALISAGIASGLSSLSPTPTNASVQSLVGCAMASVAGFIVTFLYLPRFSEVELLALGVGATVFIGGYIITFRRFAPTGLAFNLYFATILNIANPSVYDPPLLLDRCFALLFGIAVVVASFLLIFPHEGRLTGERLTRRMQELLLHAAVGRIEPNISAQIGLSMRDLILRLVSVPNLSAHYREEARNWAFGSFWIATTVLQVRHYSELYSDLMPHNWTPVEQAWLDAIAAMAKRMSSEATEAAVKATDAALAVLEQDEHDADTDAQSPKRELAIFRMTAGLFSAKLALMDHLAASDERKQTLQ